MEKVATGFTDIHSHFLYGVDDGAQTQHEMEAMLDAAQANGITELYATPHAMLGVRPFDSELCARRLEEAREYCQRRGYPMAIHAGAELLYTPALQRFVLERQLPVLGNSSLVLIEFVPHISVHDIEEAIGLLERSGYTAVLAHVERYNCLFHGKLAWQIKKQYKVLYQLNAASVIDGRGFLRDAYIRKWLRESLIDFVASDAHDCVRRPYRMQEAYNRLQQSYGQTISARLTGLQKLN